MVPPALTRHRGFRVRPFAHFSALALALLVFSAPAFADDTRPLDAFADSLMSAELAKHHVPGAVLVVVRDGQVALARGYGQADLENHVPVDPERTIFRIASVSKVVTATAAMQLVQEGKLELHTDVNEY